MGVDSAKGAMRLAPDVPVAGTSLASTARRWLADSGVDIAIVSSITLLAAAIRLWQLGSVPLGLHGDEALTGLDARRVLHEGWIGPYVISALGQPTGALYFTALLFKFMPQTTFTIRFSMALLGIATIPLAYGAFATMFHKGWITRPDRPDLSAVRWSLLPGRPAPSEPRRMPVRSSG